jgi:hypothetical protein
MPIFEEVVRQAKKAELISAEQFAPDGILIKAWASLKSSCKKGEKPEDRWSTPDDPSTPTANFHGEKRWNDTHESTTDPESKLAQGRGEGCQVEVLGRRAHEKSQRLCPDQRIAAVTGYAERDEAVEMVRRLRCRGCNPRASLVTRGTAWATFSKGLST